MESQTLNQRVEREAQRVAAAFKIEEFAKANSDSDFVQSYRGMKGEVRVTWGISKQNRRLYAIQLRRLVEGLFLSDEIDYLSVRLNWKLSHKAYFGELLARGLYRLGFEDEEVLSQLPALSAHEKLELRLSMTREFWPQTWRDEDKQETA